MIFLEPERAFAAVIPDSHPIVGAMNSGRILSIGPEGAEGDFVVSLAGSAGAIEALSEFCRSSYRPARVALASSGRATVPRSEEQSSTAPGARAANSNNAALGNSTIPGEYLTAGGRLMATGAGWLRDGVLPEPQQEIRERVARLASMMALKEHVDRLDEILAEDSMAHSQLSLFAEAERTSLLRSVLGTEDVDFTRLDAFQSRDLADAIRTALPELLERIAPDMPMQLEVYCPMYIGDYDFDVQAFPFRGVRAGNHDLASCGQMFRGIPMYVRQSADLKSEFRNFPELLEMSPETGRILLERLGGEPTGMIRFDAQLTAGIRVIRDEAPYLDFTLTAEGPYHLTSQEDLETVLLSFKAPPPKTEEEHLADRLSGEQRWFSQDREDIARLVALAEPVTGQTEGPIALFEVPARLGILGYRLSSTECPDQPELLCPFEVDSGAGSIAKALGLPEDQVTFESWAVNGLKGLALVVPAPSEAFGVPRPENVETTQYVDTVVEMDFTGVWLLEDERLDGKVLVLAGIPRRAEYVRGRDFTPYSEVVLPVPETGAQFMLKPRLEDVPQTTPISNLDIMGIKLGMPFEEAEGIVLGSMAVGWKGRNRRFTKPSIFDEGVTAYLSEDGLQQVRLVENPHDPGHIIGVLRSIVYGSQNNTNDVRISLIEKYGAPTRTIEQGGAFVQLAWLSFPSDPWDNTHPCFVRANAGQFGGIDFRSSVDGKRIGMQAMDMRALTLSPKITYGGGFTGPAGKDLGMSRLETPGFFDDCGPGIVAQIRPYLDSVSLSYSLLDLKELGKSWPAPEPQTSVSSDDL